MLSFRLLGPFEAWRHGQVIPPAAWRTRQTLTVLKVLLEERDRLVPAERLVDLVWPEASPTSGRNSLYAAVRTIRRVLEPDLRGARAGGRSRFVKTLPEGYLFQSEGCAFDVDEFLQARQVAATAEDRGEHETALRAYQQAEALYRGPYLADDPYADWALATRDRLEAAQIEILERLAGLLTARRS